MSALPWDRASGLPVPVDDRRRPEIAVLRPGLPDVATLFTFMRDAELRFQTLRLRLDETTAGSRGPQRVVRELSLRHPGLAKVITNDPEAALSSAYSLWISDGETIRTYSGTDRRGTERPAGRGVVGLEDPDLPGRSTTYRPVTQLPMESLLDTFVHPAGFAQNVLSTGTCWIGGTADVAGREAITVECDHPRTIELAADRPDHHLALAVDRETGVLLRLVETIAGEVTRSAIVTHLAPDAPLPANTFEFTFPTGTTILY